MEVNISTSDKPGWIFGTVVLTISALNLFLVHPVPAIAYFLLSWIYLPPAYALLQQWFAFSMPPLAKILFGVAIIMFTLGMSELGDMLDKL